MSTKFSEDVIPLTVLKTNPGKVVKLVSDTKRPALLASRGRGVAVVQSLSEYERAEEEREFMRGVLQGLSDLDSGRELELSEVRERLEKKD
jgi:prevent-host-death family protein